MDRQIKTGQSCLLDIALETPHNDDKACKIKKAGVNPFENFQRDDIASFNTFRWDHLRPLRYAPANVSGLALMLYTLKYTQNNARSLYLEPYSASQIVL